MYETFFSRHRAVAVAISVLTVMSGPAYAGEATESATTTVTYADLDLSTRAGIDDLHYRLHKASGEVCNVRSILESGSLRASRAAQACYDAAMKDATDKLGAMTMTVKARKTDECENSEG